MPQNPFSFKSLGRVNLKKIEFEKTFRKRPLFPFRDEKLIKPRYEINDPIFTNDEILIKENDKVKAAIDAFKNPNGLSDNKLDKNNFSIDLKDKLFKRKTETISIENEGDRELIRSINSEMRISNIKPGRKPEQPK